MFQNMEYVYLVYKERSFSKAAEKLHIAQSSLSAMIQKIEENAGTKIFDRKTRPISLTPFGIEFIRAIEQISEIEDHLHHYVDELHTLETGDLSVGVSNLSIPYLIPQRIAHFKKQYPKIRLRMMEASTLDSKQMLDGGDLDLIITNRPLEHARYETIPCYSESLLVAAPSTWAGAEKYRSYQLSEDEVGEKAISLPDQRCLSLQVFHTLPFVLLHDGNYLRRCCEKMFEEASFHPDIILEVENSSIAYNFSRLGLGASILSSVLVEKLYQNNLLLFYKPSSEYALRKGFICYKKGRFVTSAMRQFIKTILAEAL